MKKFIVAIMFMLASAFAFAIPSPKQIESAIAQKQYSTARMMIDDVLEVQPNSARAHLLNAYILVKERNIEAAKQEVRKAKSLDDKGDVISSPLYYKTVGEIDSIIASQKPRVQEYKEPAVIAPQVIAQKQVESKPVTTEAKSDGGSSFWAWFAILSGLGLVGYFGYRYAKGSSAPLTNNTYTKPTTTYSDSYTKKSVYVEPQTSETQYQRPTYNPTYQSERPRQYVPQQPVYTQPERHYGSTGSTFGNAVATAAAVGVGVVAADMIIDHMKSDDKPASTPAPEPTSSYSSGSSSNWDSTPSSYSSSSDWTSAGNGYSSGSSSSDWTSSSSNYSSGSSSDWGSSSSSSDSSSSSWD